MKITSIIVDSIGTLIDKIGNAIDKNVTSDDERLKAKKDLTNIILKYSTDITAAQERLLTAEMTGNTIQRIWRPIVMFVFTAIVVIASFVDVRLNEVPPEFWGLLKLGMGGYIIGRSSEKIVSNLSQNTEILKNRRKDRKK